MRDGRCWALTMWEPRTGEKGGGVWHSPRPTMPIEEPTKFSQRMGDRTLKCYPNLASQVKWPTPRDTDSNIHSLSRIRRAKNGTMDRGKCQLREEVVYDAETPSATGQLNPTWTSWLQGWPMGITKDGKIEDWTSLEPLTELQWLSWEVDPADGESFEMWSTPKASIDGTSKKTLEMVRNGNAENSLMRQVLMKGKNIGPIPRIATGVKDKVNRLKVLGNGQVPQCVALAWKILTTEGHE